MQICLSDLEEEKKMEESEKKLAELKSKITERVCELSDIKEIRRVIEDSLINGCKFTPGYPAGVVHGQLKALTDVANMISEIEEERLEEK